jgi:hypothetical protein
LKILELFQRRLVVLRCPPRLKKHMTKKNTRSSDDNNRSSDDIAAIEGLMGDLETRLRRLNTKAQTEDPGASGDIRQFVTEALASIAAGLREGEGADGATPSVTGDAARIGGDAIKKIWNELEQRPLVTLAVAVGLGYLVGLIGRRD